VPQPRQARLHPEVRSTDAERQASPRDASAGIRSSEQLRAFARAVGNQRMSALALQWHRDAATRRLARQGLIELPEVVVSGTACHCDPATSTDYRSETFAFVGSITPLLDSIVPAEDRLAVAGAIADEYDTRHGIRVIVDGLQDAVLDSLGESDIDTDRYFDIHNKLLNALENDVGPANIKVRTALELVQQGELAVPGSPPSDVQVHRIIDFLLTERGTVTAAAAVIVRGRRCFGAALSEVGDEIAQAVLVEYFKQGESYANRFAAARASNPGHRPCPGEGGCRFWHNIDRLTDEMS
jgi:hypothetical protein